MRDTPPWTHRRRRRMTRRALLRAAARAGLGTAGLALVGCGGDDDDTPDEPPDQADDEPTPDDQTSPDQLGSPDDDTTIPAAGADTPPAARVPQPGGIAQLFAVTDEIDRFDPHRSRFRTTQRILSLLYSRLLRPDSVSQGTLEPDLAAIPEMPDDTTYIFTIRPQAVFWDGAPANGRAVDADDVRLNVERQLAGLTDAGEPDLRFYRQSLYSRANPPTVNDNRIITFTTSQPDATYLASVHAAPWSFIVSREGLEEFAPRWDSPGNDLMIELAAGSGPYLPRDFIGPDISLARSTNWWQDDGAFLDGVIFRRPDNNAIATDYDRGVLDAVDFPFPTDGINAITEARPDDLPFEYPIDTPVQLSFVISAELDSPFSDPRLGTALSLAIDRFALIDRLYAGDARLSGPLPWYLQGWALPEDDLLTRPGYRTDKDQDLPEINALLDALGGGDGVGEVPIVVADLFEGFFPGAAQALRGMVERNAGLALDPSFRSYADITQQLRDGTLPAFFGWGPAPLQADPTDGWRRSVHSDGDENFGRYANPDADALIEEMGVTFDREARQGLAQQVQDLLLTTGFWVQNVANGIQLGLVKPYFHQDPRALDFAWAGHHLAHAWIDTNDETYPTDRELPPIPLATEDAPEAQPLPPPPPPAPQDPGG